MPARNFAPLCNQWGMQIWALPPNLHGAFQLFSRQLPDDRWLLLIGVDDAAQRRPKTRRWALSKNAWRSRALIT